MALQWTRVSDAWVAELSSPCTKKKRVTVSGYLGLWHRDIPEKILTAAEEHGWSHFGQVEGIPDVFITGPNKSTHLQVAKMVKEELGKSGKIRPKKRPKPVRPVSPIRPITPERPKAWDKTGEVKPCEAVRDKADASPDWSEEMGRQALSSKDSWWQYFYGPVQLLRNEIFEEELPHVECPICEVVWKHDVHAPAYTLASNLAQHCCGDQHRRKLQRLLEKSREAPSILIVSKLRSIRVHSLSGELRVTRREDQVNCPVTSLEPEAEAVRAAIWREGRQVIASQPESLELAWEILAFEADTQVKVEEDPELQDLKVEEIRYTQESIGERFKDGSSLEDLIYDLDHRRVDPKHPNLRLEVVKRDGRYYSNDNRRLYCLKKHQEHQSRAGWNWTVWVKAKVFFWPRAFDSFLDRYTQHHKLGDEPLVRRTSSWKRWVGHGR